MISLRCFVGTLALLACSAAPAHTVWLEALSANEYQVVFGGHAGKKESYDPKKIKSIDALDAQGKSLDVRQTLNDEGARIRVSGAAVLIAMHYDNGIHTRTATGPSVPKPMNEVPGAIKGTNAIKYHKTLVQWAPQATKPLGQPFEVVPLDAQAPQAGKPMRVRVLRDGTPVAGVKLGRGEEGTADDPVTDADGIAAFVPQPGFNKLWAGQRTPVTNNPRYTELSYEYLLGFTAQ